MCVLDLPQPFSKASPTLPPLPVYTQGCGGAYLDPGCHPKNIIRLAVSIITSHTLAHGSILILQPTASNLDPEDKDRQMGGLWEAIKTACKESGYQAVQLDMQKVLPGHNLEKLPIMGVRLLCPR